MRPRHISYRLLRRRMRRTLAYGDFGHMDQLSAPLTDAAKAYFDQHAPFDFLDEKFAASLSREACVNPCSLIVALVYLERLRRTDKSYFDATDPADLYMSALVLASKFLHDDSETDFVYNDEWASSAGCDVSHLNKLELNLLLRLDWNLSLQRAEFETMLERVERFVCATQAEARGYATYAELDVLSRCCAIVGHVLTPILMTIALASLTYLATVVGVLTGALYLRPDKLPATCTSAQLETHSESMLTPADLRQHDGTSGLNTYGDAAVVLCPTMTLGDHSMQLNIVPTVRSNADESSVISSPSSDNESGKHSSITEPHHQFRPDDTPTEPARLFGLLPIRWNTTAT